MYPFLESDYELFTLQNLLSYLQLLTPPVVCSELGNSETLQVPSKLQSLPSGLLLLFTEPRLSPSQAVLLL